MEMLHLSAVVLLLPEPGGSSRTMAEERKGLEQNASNLLLLPCLELCVQFSSSGSPRGDDRGDSAALEGSPAQAVLVVQAISDA